MSNKHGEDAISLAVKELQIETRNPVFLLQIGRRKPGNGRCWPAVRKWPEGCWQKSEATEVSGGQLSSTRQKPLTDLLPLSLQSSSGNGS